MKFIFALLAFLFFSSVQVNAQTNKGKAQDKGLNIVDEPEAIFYTSDSLKLKGYLCKPKGKGPFPVFMWNHDGEKEPDSSNALAAYWVRRGYVFFKPIRSGQSDNPGEYIRNAEKQISKRREMAQLAFRQIYALHKNANKDVIAALRWIKQQPYADTNNIVLAGYGYGGTQVLLTAEKDGNSPLGIKCFFAISPVKGWGKMWGDSLIPAVEKAKRPIFLWQARSDGDLSIMQALAPVLEKKGFPNRSKTLQDAPPPAESINTLYYYSHPEAWEKDVLKYLKDCRVRGKK
ncbi:MAG TPA: prolyl oligopeptidase family serine peptidase [Bacteroidia bacterium]|nr:prolyl oligopeptidase family serine peptidase [Bacteroidia bacterium]